MNTDTSLSYIVSLLTCDVCELILYVCICFVAYVHRAIVLEGIDITESRRSYCDRSHRKRTASTILTPCLECHRCIEFSRSLASAIPLYNLTTTAAHNQLHIAKR
jgi:hypothetical protein